MQIITIQITDSNALKLLQSLEDMHLIKVLRRNIEPENVKLSEKYKGFISAEEGMDLNNHIDQIRNEWDNI